MLRKEIIVIVLLVMSSCKTYDLTGRQYQASNQEKLVRIEFLNDTLCKVYQQFLCNELAEEYRSHVFDATYRIDRMKIRTQDENFKTASFKTDVLILNNLDCAGCEKSSVIPNYKDLDCTKAEIIDNAIEDKIKFGLIYNMTNDTLIINEDSHIVFNRLKLKPQ